VTPCARWGARGSPALQSHFVPFPHSHLLMLPSQLNISEYLIKISSPPSSLQPARASAGGNLTYRPCLSARQSRCRGPADPALLPTGHGPSTSLSQVIRSLLACVTSQQLCQSTTRIASEECRVAQQALSVDIFLQALALHIRRLLPAKQI
jgi:hypothetical protein